MATLLQVFKNHPQVSSAVAISGFVGIRLAGQTIFLGLNREKLQQAYKDGIETPVGKQSKELCQQVRIG
jgi:hypothetical protein